MIEQKINSQYIKFKYNILPHNVKGQVSIEFLFMFLISILAFSLIAVSLSSSATSSKQFMNSMKYLSIADSLGTAGESIVNTDIDASFPLPSLASNCKFRIGMNNLSVIYSDSGIRKEASVNIFIVGDQNVISKEEQI